MEQRAITSQVAGKAATPRSARRKTVFAGTLETLSRRTPVAVRNISCTGALVEGEALPEPGRDAMLKAAGLDLFCTIVWSAGERCGLQFDEPLNPAQVLELHRITPQAVRSAELKAAAEYYSAQGWYNYL